MPKVTWSTKPIFEVGLLNPRAPEIYKKARTIWYGQVSRCRYSKDNAYLRKGINVEYSLSDFCRWFVKNCKNKDLKTLSIGRIDHNKNYSFDNIEITTCFENKSERCQRLGTPKPRKPIAAIDIETGKEIGRYPSIKAASVETGYERRFIGALAKNPNRKTRQKVTFKYV